MLKDLIRRAAAQYGCEIVGVKRAFGLQNAFRGLLKQEAINLVLDVGANRGQFVGELQDLGYQGKVISFEPLAAAHAHLSQNAAAHANWVVAPRGAVGAETSQMQINVAGNSGASSSLLSMLPRHEEAAPAAAYLTTETVEVRRLDDLYHPSATDRILLKIDVQGYEQQVFDGATAVLPYCRAILVELSLQPLYVGQALMPQVWDRLDRLGFDPWWLEPGFRHPSTGRLLQMDGFFVRRGEL